MGTKEKPFKLLVNDATLRATPRVGVIDRDTLKSIVMHSFRHARKDLKEELRLMCETVERIAYGTWLVMDDYTPAEYGRYTSENVKCGCPLASISDVLTMTAFKEHGGLGVRSLTKGWQAYDDTMRMRFNHRTGWVDVI